MKKYIFILNTFILIGILLFGSCNDFLDESPSKTMAIEVKTAKELDALLGDISTFYSITNNTFTFSTDDYELNTALYNANPRYFFFTQYAYALWDIEEIATEDPYGVCWSIEYGKIFISNLILENLGKVSGDVNLKAEIEAEAHLIRAYSYIELANTYCLPYTDANKGEMGLPLKQSVSFEELNSRNTLEETYALIEADLNAAAKITTPLLKGDRVRSWRGNTAAVNAVSARYWLNRNNYDKALKFADNALKEYNILVDYNTEMHYSDNSTKVVINDSDPDKKEVVEILYPYTYDKMFLSDLLDWKEFYYWRLLYPEGWLIPSKELLSLYEENPYDLRYKYHIVEHYSYVNGMNDPAYDYPGYVFYWRYILEGPTVAEMYLIKAECLARQNKVSDAMTALNTLRKARIDKDHYTDETAANKEEAIKKIINERRREMPFSVRWADIRRYNNNENPNDDVGDLKRIFYPYTSTAVLSGETPIEYVLSKDSRRWATPIPETEVSSSQGGIKQNTY